MKARLNIDTNLNTLSPSNLLTENLRLFSNASPNFDRNLKKKIFNSLINSKQTSNETSCKSKFDKFKINMLIKERNSATSPQRDSKELSRNSGLINNCHSTEWKDEIRSLK
jgi:hypothetical protein